MAERDAEADNEAKLTPEQTEQASKREKIKKVLSGESTKEEMMAKLLEINPSLRNELAGLDKRQVTDQLRTLDPAEMLTGLSIGGKNQKDMASYKFWQTQPVPKFDEDKSQQVQEGPIKHIDPTQVPTEPAAMLDGFGWVTMDLEQEQQLEEVYELLTGHYVEDNEAMFRFNYSVSFLKWALKSPGWRKDWHVGVRASKSRKLVAFISGVPIQLRVRSQQLRSIEINFLCVHKKLRSKRLAPVLIQEITRRCYLRGIFQAIYTAGVILPKPVSSCRYYHRSLDWQKLYEVGFCALPSGSSKARQVSKYQLPDKTTLAGLRPMRDSDLEAVTELLNRFLQRSDMAPVFTSSEVAHWYVHDPKIAEQVVWCYVVEDPSSKKITDMVSFYCLESQAIGNAKHSGVRAAYLFYYASEAAFGTEFKGRLNALINDALILAKQVRSPGIGDSL